MSNKFRLRKRDNETTQEWIDRIAEDYATVLAEDADREFEYFDNERFQAFVAGANFILSMQSED